MKRSRPHVLAAIAIGLPASMLAAWRLAGGGLTLVAILWLLALVARFDNRSGTFLVLAVLVLLTIFVLLLLVALLALMSAA